MNKAAAVGFVVVRSDRMRNVVPLVLAITLTCTAASVARAQGTARQREACAPDALRLCSATVPDIAKTADCMKAHRAELSPRCQAAFAATPARTDPKGPATNAVSAAPPAGDERRAARLYAPGPDTRYIRDPDAEVPYVPPRRVIEPPLYSDPGPPLNPGGVPYDELFAGPTILDGAVALDELDDPYVD